LEKGDRTEQNCIEERKKKMKKETGDAKKKVPST